MVSEKIRRTVQSTLKPRERLLYIGYAPDPLWRILLTLPLKLLVCVLTGVLIGCSTWVVLGFVGLLAALLLAACTKMDFIWIVVPCAQWTAVIIGGVVAAGILIKHWACGIRPWLALTSHRLIVWRGWIHHPKEHENQLSTMEVGDSATMNEGNIHYFGEIAETKMWQRYEGDTIGEERTTVNARWDYVLRQVPFPHEVIERAKKVS